MLATLHFDNPAKWSRNRLPPVLETGPVDPPPMFNVPDVHKSSASAPPIRIAVSSGDRIDHGPVNVHRSMKQFSVLFPNTPLKFWKPRLWPRIFHTGLALLDARRNWVAVPPPTKSMFPNVYP